MAVKFCLSAWRQLWRLRPSDRGGWLQQRLPYGAFVFFVGLVLWLFVGASVFAAGQESGTSLGADSGTDSWFMDWASQDYMFGDWGGERTRLRERGVDFEFLYLASVPSNRSGGIETGTYYQGALLMSADVDTEKAWQHLGGKLRVSGLWLHGQDHFSDRHIGDFNKVGLVDFPNSFRLWELFYTQKFAADEWTLKIGQMAVDSDFLVPEFYNQMGVFNFQNQTLYYPTLAFNVWDIPGFPPGNHALASTPYGAPGALLRFDPSDQFYLQAGIYDGLPDIDGNGMEFKLSSDEGALSYFELGFKLNQRDGDTGLPGNYKLGGFYHSDDFWDNRSVLFAPITGSAPTSHAGTYGAYLLVDQVLFLEQGRDDPAMQGLTGFFRLTAAPKDRNLTQFGVDAGLVYKGPLPSRDWDSIGIAASYLEISDDIADSVRDINRLAPGTFPAVPDYEGLIEISYRAQMTAWWGLHASIQRVIHPSGKTLGDIPDAWTLVFMSTLRL